MKMKHFFRMTIFAVAGLLAFVACSKDEYANELENPGVVYQDSLSKVKININRTFIDSDGKKWTIRGWFEPTNLRHGTYDVTIIDPEGNEHHFHGEYATSPDGTGFVFYDEDGVLLPVDFQDVLNYVFPEADSDPCNSVSGKHGSIDMIISPSDIHLTDANNVEIDLGDEVPVELANLFSNMISEIKMSMK